MSSGIHVCLANIERRFNRASLVWMCHQLYSFGVHLIWVESIFGRGQESVLLERLVWLFFDGHIVGVSNSLSQANHRFSELISMVTKFNEIPP